MGKLVGVTSGHGCKRGAANRIINTLVIGDSKSAIKAMIDALPKQK